VTLAELRPADTTAIVWRGRRAPGDGGAHAAGWRNATVRSTGLLRVVEQEEIDGVGDVFDV